LNIELAGEFIVMAANLIYLKAQPAGQLISNRPKKYAEEDDPAGI